MESTISKRDILIETGKSKLWIQNNFTDNIYEDLHKLNTVLEVEPPIRTPRGMGRQRRDIGFFSDESIGYEYSYQIIKSQPLKAQPVLYNLLLKVNKELGTKFNGILVNRYENGEKYIGAHGDDENGLDKTKSMVVALSYGAVRNFRIRDAVTKKIYMDIPTTPCMLLVMEGQFQKEFTHEIPPQLKIKDERISLTFRHHIK